MRSKSVSVSVGGVHLRLFPQRAAYSEEHETLFVADTHLGKDATFRRHGVPVPTGGSVETLRVIENLLAVTQAKRFVILGDMFHARSSLTPETVSAVETFFSKHPAVQSILIRGNHDAHVGTLPRHWPIRVVEEGCRLGSIALGHHPGAVPTGASLLVCGHLHPAVRVGGRRDSFGKLPCFWLSKGCFVFPAIGDFTGTHVVEMKDQDRAWIIADDELVEYSTPVS